MSIQETYRTVVAHNSVIDLQLPDSTTRNHEPWGGMMICLHEQSLDTVISPETVQSDILEVEVNTSNFLAIESPEEIIKLAPYMTKFGVGGHTWTQDSIIFYRLLETESRQSYLDQLFMMLANGQQIQDLFIGVTFQPLFVDWNAVALNYDGIYLVPEEKQDYKIWSWFNWSTPRLYVWNNKAIEVVGR